jgi:hypothetical protein
MAKVANFRTSLILSWGESGAGLISVGSVSGVSLHNWRKPVFFAALMPLLQALASPYSQPNF